MADGKTKLRAPEQKLYQDQLYGAKVLTPLAVAIIDTPEFQRLSGLKQLGFADLCYRGARHTRFEHSVGAHFAARTIMRRIVQNHERFGLDHPADLRHPSDPERSAISVKFRLMPKNSGVSASTTTPQSLWRGVTEVVCAAALLHDLGHVPFGHTLEDEFVGLLRRHDGLAGPRLYTMLFDQESELARVFSGDYEPWLQEISNQELGRLIYVILNWKERVEGRPRQFDALLEEEMAGSVKLGDTERLRKERLEKLREWHKTLTLEKIFHPFMSDVVGNTICADILDYLPRDRMNLGMEWQGHTRLQRYFTIRPGTFHGPSEGLRLSIMVTRLGHGGQRRDVATAVLEVMRERYEMAERVFYHHKKAAGSAMLAKLLDIVPRDLWPRDNEEIYPAPWRDDEESSAPKSPGTPHLTHLSDTRLIDYLGNAACAAEHKILQRRLVTGLLYRRNGRKSGLYRTLLVVDRALAERKFSSSFPIDELRQPDGSGRIALENELAAAASARAGEVIIYCPDADMQAKEIDVRLEIEFESVRPLRDLADKEEFRDFEDVAALRKHYKQLWRTYVFVSPELFEDKAKCQAVVDRFCEHYGIPPEEAYKKARTHKFSKSLPESAVSSSRQTANRGTDDGAESELESLLFRGARFTDPVFVQSYASLLEFQNRRSLADEVRNRLVSEYAADYDASTTRKSLGSVSPSERSTMTTGVRERKADLRRPLTIEDWAQRLKDYQEGGQRSLLEKK